MKNKIAKIGLVFLVLLVVFGVAEKNGIISLGKVVNTKAYIQILENGTEEKTKIETGEEFSRYYYKTTAYTKNGDERIVEFSASKNLRKGACIVVYLMAEDENKVWSITTYEEVREDQIPQKTRERLRKQI
jgi:uncharacterized protein (TIGR01655 family)